MRGATRDLSRHIATVETAKHRVFTLLPRELLPDNMLIAISSDDAFVLGVLSTLSGFCLPASGWALNGQFADELRPRVSNEEWEDQRARYATVETVARQ